MSANQLSDDQLLQQFEKMLMKYGQADATGYYRKRLEYKKALNHMAEELLRRGHQIPYVRTIV